MEIEIINKGLEINLYGVSGRIANYDYGWAGRKFMYTIWKEITTKNIKHKGVNYWVYEQDEMMFTGVELEENPSTNLSLELKKINLKKYAYCKHIGPYHGLSHVISLIQAELRSKAVKFNYPFLEVCGQWTDDETKLETGIILALE